MTYTVIMSIKRARDGEVRLEMRQFGDRGPMFSNSTGRIVEEVRLEEGESMTLRHAKEGEVIPWMSE